MSSLTAPPAPRSSMSSRKGGVQMPAMGAKIKGEAKSTDPKRVGLRKGLYASILVCNSLENALALMDNSLHCQEFCVNRQGLSMKKNKSQLQLQHIVFDHDDTLVDPSGGGKLFEGVGEMLERLEESGAKLYVWTARPRPSTVEFLRTLGIINRFELLSCGYENEPKPSASGLADILFDVEP